MATEGPEAGHPLKLTDPQLMRVLAHPARQVILNHLSHTGESVTATECARVSGQTPSATSYHLRELAKFGLVEEAPSRGDGRERVWRAKVTGLQMFPGRSDDPETTAAERAVLDAFMIRQNERVRRMVERARDEPEEWYKSWRSYESVLLVTAEELADLNAKFDELIEPYKRRVRAHDGPADARSVAIYYQAMPTD